ncbi:MAG: transcription-repair coupling factor [Phycisphaerales bacterium JB061]
MANDSPLKPMLDSDAVRALAGALGDGSRCVAAGAVGSSSVVLASCLARLTGRPVLLVMAHLDEAEHAVEELAYVGTDAIRLPALEVLPGESGAAADLLAERVSAVRKTLAVSPKDAPVIVAPVHALMQAVPRYEQIAALSRRFKAGDQIKPEELIEWLADAGYTRRETIEDPGEFAVRGGIIDVFPAGGSSVEPVRLDFFGDEIDRITEIDLETMGSDRRVPEVEFVAATFDPNIADEGTSFLNVVPDRAIAVLCETLEVTEQARGYFERLTDSRGVFGPPAVLKLMQDRFHAFCEVNQFSTAASSADVVVELPIEPLPPFSREIGDAITEFAELLADKNRSVLVPCEKPAEEQRLGELLAEKAPKVAKKPIAKVGYVHRGFSFEPEKGKKLSVVPYHELVHRFHARRGMRKLRAGRAMDTFLEIDKGDYVVHTEHGIARFEGLRLMNPDRLGKSRKLGPPTKSKKEDESELQEFLTLEFANGSQLHVPALKIDLVQKYIGGFNGKPPLSMLGGQRWKKQKEKVVESVRDLASELLRVRAARESLPGVRFPGDTAWQKEFEAEFPYQETDDQLAAIGSIKKDMQSDRPMDRLLCGDVGFGKTELAIRAAFKVCEAGKQVAVLVPTTVLAEQHERTFKDRFAGYPFKIESLSRLKSTKQSNAILASLRKGQIDVLVGTHRILSKDVKFADLGLVVVDEEQRFGVEHKEQLLRLRLAADVLTLSATPIPRTLHMSMLGIRDISSLATPPADRQSIVTEVTPFNRKRAKQAIDRELSRQGQVFWVHNRVHDIISAASEVQALAPGARVIYGHGQMQPAELEKVMLKFIRHEADILVSTTIIESGIDIPNANTMIIEDADRFGLSELHQLRGRVGRSKHRAYCYLMLPETRKVTEIARKRLKALEQYTMLGAGFKIAMRDLEIRGAGNILGSEQSGHIAAVGYEMYCQLLEQQVRDLRHEAPPPSASRASLEIGVWGHIPKPYIPSDVRRLEAYRRMAVASSREELEKLREDLTAAYGSPPEQVDRILRLAEIRVACSALGVRSVVLREPDIIFKARKPAKIRAALEGAQGSVNKLPPKSGEKLSEVYWRPPAGYLDPQSLPTVLLARLTAQAVSA